MIKKLRKKEIHFAWGLGIILAVSLLATTIVSSQAYTPQWYFGGRIQFIQPAGTCSCPNEPICIHGCPCDFTDVSIAPFLGGTNYVCVPATFPVYGLGLIKNAKIFGYGSSFMTPSMIWTVNR